jgi:hypothetical protein
MKIKKEILEKINTPKIRRKLSVALDKTEQTIIQYIKTNNDTLTKYAGLTVIKDVTGLCEEQLFEI